MPPASSLATTTTGAGPRLVLVHGFTQTGRSYARLVEQLRGEFEVVTIDLPGHGDSTSFAVDGLEDAARALGEAGGRATYVGYSLGGRICLTLALADPSLVERLVLVSATAGIENVVARTARVESDRELADRLDPPGGPPGDLERFLGEWLAGPLFAHLGLEAQGFEARRENTPKGLAESLRSLGTGRQIPSWYRLGGLTMPVLTIAGELDVAYVEHAARLAEEIGPNATAEIVVGVGHAVPFEAPGTFVELLRAFLTVPPEG